MKLSVLTTNLQSKNKVVIINMVILNISDFPIREKLQFFARAQKIWKSVKIQFHIKKIIKK